MRAGGGGADRAGVGGVVLEGRRGGGGGPLGGKEGAEGASLLGEWPT